MLEWIDMIGTYEDRVVDNFKNDLFTIDTAWVSDREQPYEIAIAHKNFNNGNWIVLGWSDTKEEAQTFHNRMVEFFRINAGDITEITDAYTGVTYARV